MKYYVFVVSNGDLQTSLTTEHTDINDAIAKYHERCALFRKDASVQTACITIIDNYLNRVGDYREYIDRTQNVQPEPVEE